MRDIGEATLAASTDSTAGFRTAATGIEVRALQQGLLRISATTTDTGGPRYVPRRAWEGARLETLGGTKYGTERATVTISLVPFRLDIAMMRIQCSLSRIALGVEPESGAHEVRMRVPRGHHFYGLGHGGQQFDRLGSSRCLWNSHTLHGTGSDFAIPLIICQKGYALFFDNSARGTIAVAGDDEGTEIVFRAESGGIDFYLLIADSPREVMNLVGELLGKAPMPPKWLLGYMQSTRHFSDTAEVQGLARELRSRRIPCDSLVFLSTYGEDKGWNRSVGSLDFQPELWNGPRQLVDQMRTQHFEVILHEYPVVHPDSPSFAEGKAMGHLLAEGYETPAVTQRPATGFHEGQRYIDFSDAEARRWWWQQHRALLDLKVGGWWLDGGEGPSAEAVMKGGAGAGLHNRYDLDRQQAFAEGEALDRPDQRPVMLCRSGAAGMQRLGAACWSGDIDNTFAAFAAQVPRGLNTALSGVPYWGTDIGGFFHPVEESGELFVRWFQFGAFCPIFRAHGYLWREHVPWAHGREIEEICRRFVELRYELLPYTYTLAHEAAEKGLPLMRPLCLNYPMDSNVADLGDEYLWGDDLLVAPVTKAGARHWSLYLPEGAWFDFWTNRRYEGMQGVEVEAPLQHMPLLVREGAILPMSRPMQYTEEHPLDEVTLLIYPAGHSSFELYEDDGRTNGYARGSAARTHIRSRRGPAGVEVEIEASMGDSSHIPPHRTYLIRILSNRPSKVVDGEGKFLRELRGAGEGGAGWWHEEGFTHVKTERKSGTFRVIPL